MSQSAEANRYSGLEKENSSKQSKPTLRSIYTRNSSGDEIPERDIFFIYDHIVHVLRNAKITLRLAKVYKKCIVVKSDAVEFGNNTD